MKRFSRRTAIKSSLTLAIAAPFIGNAAMSRAEFSAQSAHDELWRRLIDQHGVMLDYTNDDGRVSIPTPEECREGRPNALGWWSPIENGGMFNGYYMDAAIQRWRYTKSKADEAKAQRLMEGLLKLSAFSTVRGFVARGMAMDGQGHYPMGSNDQTSPWFYGLWLYLRSDICSLAQRERIVARLTETAETIQSNKWLVPAEEPFRIRGSFAGVTWESAPRAVFIAKLMHHVTKDPKWDRIYRELLAGKAPGGEGPDRLGVCERGMIFEHEKRHSWTAVGGVTSLRALWEMETDGKLKDAYGRGLQASAMLAMDSLPLAQQFDVEKPQKFEGDWRKLNPFWEKQTTEQDAVRVAMVQVRELGKMSPGRYQEHTFVREPSFAAWVASLAPDKSILTAAAPEIEKVIGHYRYNTLRYSQFFPCESAWWRLRTTLS